MVASILNMGKSATVDHAVKVNVLSEIECFTLKQTRAILSSEPVPSGV